MYHFYKKYLWFGIGIIVFLFIAFTSFNIPIQIIAVLTALFIFFLPVVAVIERHKNNLLDKMQREIIEHEHRKIKDDSENV